MPVRCNEIYYKTTKINSYTKWQILFKKINQCKSIYLIILMDIKKDGSKYNIEWIIQLIYACIDESIWNAIGTKLKKKKCDEINKGVWKYERTRSGASTFFSSPVQTLFLVFSRIHITQDKSDQNPAIRINIKEVRAINIEPNWSEFLKFSDLNKYIWLPQRIWTRVSTT